MATTVTALVALWAVPRSTETSAYALGEVIGVGAIDWVVAYALLHVDQLARQRGFTMLLILVLTVVGCLLTTAGSATGHGRSGTRVSVSAPTQTGTYSRLAETPELQALRASALQQPALRDASSVELARYGAAEQGPTVLFMGINLRTGSSFDREVVRSPARAVTSLLAGAGVGARDFVEPGPLGGALMCGPSPTAEPASFTCAWGTTGVMGLVVFAGTASSVDDAGRQVRALRQLAEHPLP